MYMLKYILYNLKNNNQEQRKFIIMMENIYLLVLNYMNSILN